LHYQSSHLHHSAGAELSKARYPMGKSVRFPGDREVGVKRCLKKYSAFQKNKSPLYPSRLVPLKGALAIVTTRGGMRWTRVVLLTRAPDADGEDVWS
jgi:hypothetical protein